MNRFSALAILTTTLALPVGASPDDGSTPAAGGQTMVDVSPARYLPAWLQIGGQVRGRFERPSGRSLLDGDSDGYYLSRIRVDLGVKPAPWLRFFVQAQDARTGAYNTAPVPTTYYNPMDIHQGYVELGHEGRVATRLRAGRQEVAIDNDRLVGAADWHMSRSFDVLDLSFSRGRTSVDFVAGSPVLIDGSRFDRHKPGEHFYAAWAGIKNILPGVTAVPFVLFKQNKLTKSEALVPGDAIVASPGLRLTGTFQGRFDYVGEASVQRGSYSGDRIAAAAVTGLLGWTVSKASWKPRVSVEYNYASGDPAFKDGHRNTFDQFYPGNHGYYGMLDQFAWKNLKNFRAGFDLVAARKLKVRADYNDFRLATVQDALYTSAGGSCILNRSATSAHVGYSVNAVALYQWTKIWKFGAGLGRLYAGEYLKQSRYPFGYTLPYVMFTGTL